MEKTTDANKKIMQRYFLEMWNKKDDALVEQLVSENYQHHKLDGSMSSGRDHIYNVRKWVYKNYPDIQYEIKLMIAENDFVATYLEGNAKHPNPSHFKETFFHRIKDGVIVEGWALPVKS